MNFIRCTLPVDPEKPAGFRIGQSGKSGCDPGVIGGIAPTDTIRCLAIARGVLKKV